MVNNCLKTIPYGCQTISWFALGTYMCKVGNDSTVYFYVLLCLNPQCVMLERSCKKAKSYNVRQSQDGSNWCSPVTNFANIINASFSSNLPPKTRKELKQNANSDELNEYILYAPKP